MEPVSARPGCPVIREAKRVTDLALELGTALRRYYRAKKLCQSCPIFEECTAIQEIEAIINTTIRDFQEEWMDV